MADIGAHDKHLVLFFTYGVSLTLWERIGQLSREKSIYESLARRLGKVTFLTYGVDDPSLTSAITPVALAAKPTFLPNLLYSMVIPFLHSRLLRSADIYKTNQMSGAWAAVLSKYLYQKPLVVRCGYEWRVTSVRERVGPVKRTVIRMIERLAYGAADVIIVTSDDIKANVCRNYSIAPAKIEVLPNGIDINLFKPDAQIAQAPHRLIHVGRLSREKNLAALIEGVKGLGGVELLLVGDGPLRSELADLAKKSKVAVSFIGSVPNDELPQLLNSARVFVFPSLYEGSPKALFEAMACGLPVVATPAPGVSSVIEHGKNGFLARDASPEGLKAAIQTVLDDKDLCSHLGKGARQTIVESYSVSVLLDRETAIYEELLGGPR